MTGDLNKELAEVLRELRRASKHRSQLLFSIAVGRDRSYISKIERNLSSPTAEVLFELAEQLEMPLSEIIKKVEDRVKEKKSKQQK